MTPRLRSFHRWFCAVLVLLSSSVLHAQQSIAPGGGGDTSPPTITFTPLSGTTVYAPNPSVTISMCDNQTLNGPTRRITLNGDTVPYQWSTSLKTGCGSYWIVVPTLNLVPGANTVSARVCDSAGNCTTTTATYTYVNTPDQTAPTIQISPGTQTVTSATFSPVVTLCDERKLGTFGVVKLDTTTITGSWTYTPQTGTGTCPAKATFTGPVQLQSGDNVLLVQARDSAGNLGSQSVTYTYRGNVDVSPNNGNTTAPGMFDALLAYGTPSYRSLDQDRSTTLFYSSSQASPVGLVQVDVTDNSSNPAPKASIRLQRNGQDQPLWGGVTEVFYNTGAGTSRVSAGFDASQLQTGAYSFTAIVRRWMTDTTFTETSTPVRVLVVNERNSPYGAGWSIAGAERVVPTTGGILITHGDGSADFYQQYTTCTAARLCYYGNPAGVYESVAYDSVNARYIRRSLDGTTSYFAATGPITSIQDRVGNLVTFQYSGGVLSTITDPVGLQTTFSYDANGKLAGIATPDGRLNMVSVDGAGDLVSVSDPAEGMLASGMSLQPSYQASTHRLTGWLDAGDRPFNVTYDGAGRLATALGPQFTAEGNQTFRETTTMISQDRAVLPAPGKGSKGVPADRVDPVAVRAQVTDFHGRMTRVRLDAWGPARVEDPRGYVTTASRNSAGQVVSATDDRGNTTTYAWEGPNLIRATAAGATVEYAYNGYGQLTTITGVAAETVNFYNPTTGVLDSTRTAGVGTTRYTRDARGRVLTTTDPQAHVTTVMYADTSIWKNTATVTEGGRTTRYTHDGAGRVSTVTGPDGKTIAYEYDVFNRVLSEARIGHSYLNYGWGRLFLENVTDQRGPVFSWTRNQVGWVLREVRLGDPAGKNLTASYDRYGRVDTTTNRRGQKVVFTYDSWDRVATRTADGQTTSFAYSPFTPAAPNSPTWVAVANPEGIDTLRYDEKGQMTDAVTRRPFGGTWQRYATQPHYNVFGQVTGVGIATPAGRDSLGYGYNSQTFRLQNFTDMALGLTSIAYSSEGLPSQATLPNGLVSTQTYTSTHMPEQLRYPSNSTLDNVAGVRYRYDALNRVQSRSSGDGGTLREFNYDANGQWLSSAIEYQAVGNVRPVCNLSTDDGVVCDMSTATWNPQWNETYAYNLSGNPTDRGAVQGSGDKLTQFNGYTLTYDDDGNLATKTAPGFSQTFTWNTLGQLASVTTNGVTVSYGYDGLGQRVRKQVNGASVGYLYDGYNLLYEMDGTGGITAKYTYYPGTLQPHSVVRGGVTYYYATDVQGSVLAMFNSSNQLLNQYRYRPFGEAQSVTATVPNRIRYAGRELEDETGLYYNNARWYDPSLHRFISQDPIGLEGGINLYTYVGNDPVNFVDPSGNKMLPTCPEITRKMHPGITEEMVNRICGASAFMLLPLIVVAAKPYVSFVARSGATASDMLNSLAFSPVYPAIVIKTRSAASGFLRRTRTNDDSPQGNSMRHLFGSCFLALNYGKTVAEFVTGSHETYLFPGNARARAADSAIDQRNNAVGILYGTLLREGRLPAESYSCESIAMDFR